MRKEYKREYHSLIPTIRDRVVQQALKNVIEPIFEAEFSDSSLGYRPKKSAKQAIECIEAIRDKGHEWIVDVDIQAFFDIHGESRSVFDKGLTAAFSPIQTASSDSFLRAPPVMPT